MVAAAGVVGWEEHLDNFVQAHSSYPTVWLGALPHEPPAPVLS